MSKQHDKLNIEATVLVAEKCSVFLAPGDSIHLHTGVVKVATYKATRKVTIVETLIFDSPLGYGGLFKEEKNEL